jgi:hypothetical protein
MMRLLTRLVLAFLVVCILADGAQAEPKKGKQNGAQAERKKGKQAKKSVKPVMSEEIAPTLGTLKWGMSENDVLKMLVDKIRDHYKNLVSKTKDAVEDDRLRTTEREKVKNVRESLVRFDGQSTGWNLGFLQDEFTHNNGESMVVMKDSNSQNFYFFINGRLWKWYKALDVNLFAGKDFDQFSAAMQRKFGDGKQMQGELAPGSDKRQWVEWEDKTTRLRAVDQTAFYGFYCLVFEEKSTLNELASLRRTPPKKKSQTHPVVESVTSSENASANPDTSPNIVDRITGKVRQNEQAQQVSEPAQGRRKGTASGKATQSPSQTSQSPDNDPISGLEF